MVLGVSTALPADIAYALAGQDAEGTAEAADTGALPAGDELTVAPQLPAGDFTIPQSATDSAPEAPVVPVITSKPSITPPGPNGSISELNPVITSQTETSTESKSPTGSTVTRISSAPLNVQAEDGSWVSPQTTLSRAEDAGDNAWTVEDHPLSPVFEGGDGTRPSVTVEREGHSVSFSLIGATDGDLVTPFWWWDDWEQLTYEDVRPDTDLEYRIEPGEVKESLVLDKVPSRSSWSWALSVGDLQPRLADAGAVELVDATGTPIFLIPTPVATDSSGVEGTRSDAEVVLKPYIAKQSDGSWRYTVQADKTWLADPARVYPVRIDPTFTAGWAERKSWKSDGTPSNGTLNVGNTRENNTNRYWRSVVGFNYGSVPGKFIKDAALLVNYDGYGTTSNQTGWIQHASSFAYNGTGPHLANYNLSTGTAESEGWGVAQRLASQLRIGDHPAFMVGGWEGSSYSYKRVTVDLVIESWDYPTVWGTRVGNGAVGVGLRPTLGADSTNASGSEQKFFYQVATDSAMSNIIAGRDWETGRDWQVSEDALAPGRDYYWRVFVKDEYDGHLGQSTVRESPVYKFTTNQVPLPSASTATPGKPVGETPETVTTLTPTAIFSRVGT